MPTIQQFQEIQGRDGKTIHIMDTVASEWEEIAIAMGFPAHELKTLRKDNIRDAKGATVQIFSQWLEGSYSTPVSWGTLVDCLDRAGFSNVALDLQEMFY